MFLNLEKFGVPMKIVYNIEDDFRDDPLSVSKVQALTLNSAKPLLGLRGKHGLYGSAEWWASIREARIPLLYKTGVIRLLYAAGQDANPDEPDSIEIEKDDGSVDFEGIYVNNSADMKLFKPGCKVGIVYALDERKVQPAADGGINYSEITLEMAVSIA